MGWDSATFQDKGTEVPSLSREKGKKGQKFLHCLGTKRQQDELKILLRDGTGFLHLPLSRDKGTAGHAKFFCSGTKRQRDRETFLSRDDLQDVPSRHHLKDFSSHTLNVIV